MLFPGFSSDSMQIDAAVEAMSVSWDRRSATTSMPCACSPPSSRTTCWPPIREPAAAHDTRCCSWLQGRPRRPCRFLGAFPKTSLREAPSVRTLSRPPFCSTFTPAPADCERLLYGNTVADLRSYVRDHGGQDLIFHTFALSTDQRALDVLGDMARSGLGEQVQQTASTLDFLAVDVAQPGTRLVLREIVVMNGNALLRGPSPVPDSDGDGLSDDEEASWHRPPES